MLNGEKALIIKDLYESRKCTQREIADKLNLSLSIVREILGLLGYHNTTIKKIDPIIILDDKKFDCLEDWNPNIK
ncbi:hypothetical protein LGL08_22135 [Clostridium estertheticum]|uniref:hypothetical protein n=1 Tax=Clostridium estertheticum TaxID=238834 RepID=UPI001CF31058|nr:hypothetical protein [Clostridium estertheticum]MCB2309264.1 hypothetical protein [Clostridium estertheticum]MCB2346797.1 hypothetical protein [Clostridium estertheticum]MCB2352225.1 hypothetical protein [Clostridium estertheticum]WAG48536.1 hypothetical protein LL127_23665 [Clostridium estertheticum]